MLMNMVEIYGVLSIDDISEPLPEFIAPGPPKLRIQAAAVSPSKPPLGEIVNVQSISYAGTERMECTAYLLRIYKRSHYYFIEMQLTSTATIEIAVAK